MINWWSIPTWSLPCITCVVDYWGLSNIIIYPNYIIIQISNSKRIARLFIYGRNKSYIPIHLLSVKLNLNWTTSDNYEAVLKSLNSQSLVQFMYLLWREFKYFHLFYTSIIPSFFTFLKTKNLKLETKKKKEKH